MEINYITLIANMIELIANIKNPKEAVSDIYGHYSELT